MSRKEIITANWNLISFLSPSGKGADSENSCLFWITFSLSSPFLSVTQTHRNFFSGVLSVPAGEGITQGFREWLSNVAEVFSFLLFPDCTNYHVPQGWSSDKRQDAVVSPTVQKGKGIVFGDSLLGLDLTK